MTTRLADPTRIEPGGALEYARAVARNFFEDPSEEDLHRWLPLLQDETYRAWVVRDGGDVVANYGMYSMDVSMPGGGRVPMAGVTAVGVAQTHRRRGLLSAMMCTGLDDAVERGEPVAMLYASESPIYGRYGFGICAPSAAHVIDRGAALHEPVDPHLVEAASTEDAARDWPGILERVRSARGGAASRNETQWRFVLEQDPESWRDGFSAKRRVHVPGRGYAFYRIKDVYGDDGLPKGEVRVLELLAADAEAEAALWQHVLDIDLTTKVSAWYRPPDDALLALLVDPLRARTRGGPPLYARVLDVAAAFSARAYTTTDTMSFAVVDPTRDTSGTYRLDASPQGVEVSRVDDDPLLTIPIDALGSVWLGGMRATQLLAGRRLQEHSSGAAARLDRLLATDVAPWNPFEF